MAEKGNVAAAKYLHSLMVERSDASGDYDPWAEVAAEINPNLAQSPDFGKIN